MYVPKKYLKKKHINKPTPIYIGGKRQYLVLKFHVGIKTDKVQSKKSRYIGWFLIPVIPEIVLRKNDFKKFRRLWKNSSAEELNDYLTVFRRKGALTAALNYYRANLGRGKRQSIGDITRPTLFIWGKNDLAVGRVAAENNHKYMKGDYTFLELDGGHWLIQTNYPEVEKAIIEHLTKNKTTLEKKHITIMK